MDPQSRKSEDIGLDDVLLVQDSDRTAAEPRDRVRWDPSKFVQRQIGEHPHRFQPLEGLVSIYLGPGDR